METTIKKTWKPVAAGILNIITGSISTLGAIFIIIFLTSIDTWVSLYDTIPAEDLPFATSFINTILYGTLILSIIHIVLPVIGGVFSIQRKKWGWSLAGSITAIIAVFPLGVASTVFVAMARDEFE
ncbi:hypothetical protein ACFLWR_01775 [Chloroflexota bacterium]